MTMRANVSAVMIWTRRKIFNIGHILVGNIIVDHSDVVGASPVYQDEYGK